MLRTRSRWLFATFTTPNLKNASQPFRLSLCKLCVLCVSVVNDASASIHHRGTEDAEVAQRRTRIPHELENTMNPHKLTLCVIFLILSNSLSAQTRKPPTGGRLAIVVDERLAAIRATPQLTGKLVRRLSRGRMVAVRSYKLSSDGV